ncbi:MAG: Nif3-like dinuclear metal center hexameric protein, partial [Clostridia bacterium]|nr:Nif3-like dinuclear metal center hexameric protein [Clostridia bacterium]
WKKRLFSSYKGCSGSGGNYISQAINGGFDALITADVKHNHFIDAVNNDFSLFDAGHYNTENIVLEPLCELLGKKFKNVSFIGFSPDKIKCL